jgi:hypothetical protein
MQWPPQSPDLNPVENLWCNLKHRIEDMEVHGLDHLWSTAVNQWMATSPSLLEKLLASMSRRVQAVIKSRGGPTVY